MKKFLVSLVLMLALLAVMLGPALPVFTATAANVSINATPSYVSISNSPNNYGFGTIAVSTNTSTAINYFTITNGSSVNINIAIGCNSTWAGGVTWTHSDTGTPGANTAALYATPNTAAWNIIVKNAAQQNLYSATATATLYWGIRLMAPTSFGDGVLKTNTVTLTATAS